MFTEDQKIDVRRFLGYPVGGNPPISPAGAGHLLGGLNGYRFFQASGTLEFKMNNLQPLEEAKITGQSTGVVRVLSGPDPTKAVGSGLDLALTLLIDDIAVDTIMLTTSSVDTVMSIGTLFANGVLASSLLQAESFQALAPTSLPAAPFIGLQIMCPRDFTIQTAGSDPVILAVSPGSGLFTNPKVTFEEEGEFHGFLPILTILENKMIGQVSDNLDTDKADVWTARKSEPEDRQRLFDYWRFQFSRFLNTPLFEDTPHQARYMRGRRGASLMSV